MTTTPDLLRDGDATPGVDALATRFITSVDGLLTPEIAELEATTEGRLGLLLEALTPGPALAALLANLDPTLLAPMEQVAYLTASERLTAWVASLQNTGLVAFTGTTPAATQYTVDGRTQVLVDARRTEIATHLLWSEGVARSRVATARTLASDLPQTRQALTTGAMSLLRATAITEGAIALTSGIDTLLEHEVDGVERIELHTLRSDMLTAFEARVTDYATSHDTSRTRAHVTRTIARLDPNGWAARRTRAIRTHSNVTLRHLADGLSELTAVMPTEHAITCAHTIDTRARALQAQAAQAGDRQTPIGVHRTTALVNLISCMGPVGVAHGRRRSGAAHTQGSDAQEASLGSCTTADANPRRAEELTDSTASDRGTPAVHRGATTGTDRSIGATIPVSPRLQLAVTIDLPTLLALREGVGEIAGAGPIPANVVRELIAAGGAAIRWLTTNPAGHITGASPGYRIPEPLRALIISRDRTCAMPNCSTPASACEIDHIQPWNTGGPTTPDNLQALCKRHHQTKTHSHPIRALPARDLTATLSAGSPLEGNPINSNGSKEIVGSTDGAATSLLTGHPLADLAPLHTRLAPLQQQLEELTEIGLTDSSLEARITELDTQAVHLFDDTLDLSLADALPRMASEGAISVMLHHALSRHHHRTCRATGSRSAGAWTNASEGHGRPAAHSMQHCPALTRPADTPPF